MKYFCCCVSDAVFEEQEQRAATDAGQGLSRRSQGQHRLRGRQLLGPQQFGDASDPVAETPPLHPAARYLNFKPLPFSQPLNNSYTRERCAPLFNSAALLNKEFMTFCSLIEINNTVWICGI